MSMRDFILAMSILQSKTQKIMGESTLILMYKALILVYKTLILAYFSYCSNIYICTLPFQINGEELRCCHKRYIPIFYSPFFLIQSLIILQHVIVLHI